MDYLSKCQSYNYKTLKKKTEINLHEFGKEFLAMTAKTKQEKRIINWTL